MKVGKFADNFNLNKDTIRYYTELGLLLPKKKSNYYEYNQQCINDMNKILEFKNSGFTLNEISKILSFLRLTGFIDKKNSEPVFQILENKKKELKTSIIELENKISNINNCITDFEKNFKTNETPLGLPISFLNHMACPKCDNILMLKNSKILGTQILEGDLTCTCGYTSHIKDGIIFCNEFDMSPQNPHKNIEENFSNIESGLIKLLQKSSNYISTQLFTQDLSNKIIIEINADIGLITKQIINNLKNNTIYIITGETFKIVLGKKKSLERLTNKNNFVFLVNNQLHPIKKSTIDICIDGYASNFNFLFNSTDLIADLKPYLKPNSKLIGAYFSYNNLCLSLENINENTRKYFLNEYMINSFSSYGFNCVEKLIIGKTKNTGHALVFHNQHDFLQFGVYKGNFK